MDIEMVARTNHLTSVHEELSVQGVIINSNQNKDEKDVNNEHFTGLEIMKKSVSWAKEENLVEMYEVEGHRSKSLSFRILECLCCKSNFKEMKEFATIRKPFIREIRIFWRQIFCVTSGSTIATTKASTIMIEGGVGKMADYSYSENQSIKDSVKSLKKYGSTCNHIKRADCYVTHTIQKTDTLQGLAVKYNTTTEQIRRINRLFASDSLFLRDHLKIPVARELANSYEGNNYHSGSVSDTVTSSLSTESFTDEEDKSVNDFFGKIDNSIAGIRDQVKEVEKHSSVVDSTKTAGMLTKNHYKKQPHRSHPTAVSSNNDVFVTPHPVVLNRGRKVKSSLQRLEKEQDELFEL